MKNIDNRLVKLEMALGKENDLDLELSAMTPEEREHRIAELIYKGLIDTDPKVKLMTEADFIELYLSSGPRERATLCGYDFTKGSIEDQLLDSLKARYEV